VNLSKREKVLGGSIFFILFGWIILQYGFLQVYDVISSRSDALSGELKTYTDYVEKINKGPRIRRLFQDVKGRNTEVAKNTDPTKAFSEFVSELCRTLGFSYPRIEPPKVESIEDAEGFSFIILTVNVQGNLQNVEKLLKGFDREAILIRELNLRITRIDSKKLDVTMTVARMVETEKEEKTSDKKKKKKKGAKRTSLKTRTTRKPLEEEE
jgi:hypothetical protein